MITAISQKLMQNQDLQTKVDGITEYFKQNAPPVALNSEFYDTWDLVYHYGPGVSNSGLKAINRSPSHFYSQYIAGDTPEPTDAMKFGSFAHLAVLKWDQFIKQYRSNADVPCEQGTRTKAWREAADAFCNEHKVSLIKEDWFDKIVEMAAKVHNHPTAQQLLSGGLSEQSLYWVDQRSKVLCKAKADYIKSGQGLIIDYKTTQDARPSEFERSCWNFRYDQQAAHYIRAAANVTGTPSDAWQFVFIVQEKEPPYEIGIYVADRGMVDKGEEIIDASLEMYATCVQNNKWPGYSTQPHHITLPSWAWGK